MAKVEKRIQELGIVLPNPAKPVASYLSWVQSGNLVFTAGQLPFVNGKLEISGTCALNIIALLSESTDGNLDKVIRIVKLTGFVAAGDGFWEFPNVLNGASNLFVEIFGEQGRHARSAVGVKGLPLNAPVEIEVIAEVS
jgi:enamine deaminase RidA (YjgF/YER057c/UK114 family)